MCHISLSYTRIVTTPVSHVIILVVIVSRMSADDGDGELPLVDPFEPCCIGNHSPHPIDEIDRVNTLDTNVAVSTKSSIRISSSSGFRATPRGFRKEKEKKTFVAVSILIVTKHVRRFEKSVSRFFPVTHFRKSHPRSECVLLAKSRYTEKKYLLNFRCPYIYYI